MRSICAAAVSGMHCSRIICVRLAVRRRIRQKAGAYFWGPRLLPAALHKGAHALGPNFQAFENRKNLRCRFKGGILVLGQAVD